MFLELTWVHMNRALQYCEADQYWYLQEIKQNTSEHTDSSSTAQDITLTLGSGIHVLAFSRNSLRIFAVTIF